MSKLNSPRRIFGAVFAACLLALGIGASIGATWNWDGNNNLFVAPVQGGTPVVSSSTGGAQANTVSMAAVSGKTNYVGGFTITGLGATAASAVAVTLSDGTNTLDFTQAVPAGVGVPCYPLTVIFEAPLPAVASNTAWTLTVPTFGSGNTAATATIWGFKN